MKCHSCNSTTWAFDDLGVPRPCLDCSDGRRAERLVPSREYQRILLVIEAVRQVCTILDEPIGETRGELRVTCEAFDDVLDTLNVALGKASPR